MIGAAPPENTVDRSTVEVPPALSSVAAIEPAAKAGLTVTATVAVRVSFRASVATTVRVVEPAHASDDLRRR